MNRSYGSEISRFPLAFLLAAGALLFSGCGSSLSLPARWSATPPVIDGLRDPSWNAAMQQLPDHDMMVAVLNDSQYVYVSLVTDDRGIQRQVLMRGLTVWFDREGGSEKRFGIHYPIGSAPIPGRSGRYREGREGPPEGAGENREEADLTRFPFESTEAEIFGPIPGEHVRMSTASMQDLAVKIGFDGGTMIYELRVPFRDRGANPYAIGTAPGTEIGLGFETGGGMGGRRGDGGGFSPGMGTGGRGDRGGFGGGPEGGVRSPGGWRVEPLNIWMKILPAGP